MVYITGDTHGDAAKLEKAAAKLSENDTLLIAGDFGFIFFESGALYEEKEAALDHMERFPFNIAFIDGNHENFNRLEAYPETEKFGAPVHQIRKNVFHLERGRVYTIEGKTFFCFGGAYSPDCAIRVENVSHWTRELPSPEEEERGTAALADYGNRVDYILTHTAPAEIIKRLGFVPEPHDLSLRMYLGGIEFSVSFSEWFFGHFHIDRRNVIPGFSAVYEETIEL